MNTTCRRPIRAAAAALACATLALPVSSRALTPAEAVDDCKQRGRPLLAGDPAAALDLFRSCYAHAAGDEELVRKVLYYAALACEELRDDVCTLEFHQRFQRLSGPGSTADQTKWAKYRRTSVDIVGKLEPAVLRSHGALDVDSDPGDLSVAIDGAPYEPATEAATPLRVYLPPGEHWVRVELEGHVPCEQRMTLAAGQRARVQCTMAPLPAPLGPEPPPPPVEPGPGPTSERDGPIDVVIHEPDDGLSRSALGWVFVGSGAAVALVGVPFSVLSAENVEDVAALETVTDETAYWEQRAPLEKEFDLNVALQATFYAVGGAMVVTGAVLLALGHEPEAVSSASVRLTPLPGGGLVLGTARW